jgi:Polyketide cyclase / dehydrase and lipid transport
MRAYQIRLKGELDPKLSAWFGDFTVNHTPDGDTLLSGIVADQAALYGIMGRCRDFGVTLISVNPLPDERQSAKSDKETIMNWIHVEASGVVDARPDAIYAVISDYQVGHPAIVPKQYFTELVVEKGGQGAGTAIRGNVRVLGGNYPLHQLVSEPEPGRVLMETDIETGQYTTFTIEPLNGGSQSRVTIASEFPSPGGFAVFMTRLMLPPVTRKMYREELGQLAAYVKQVAVKAV